MIFLKGKIDEFLDLKYQKEFKKFPIFVFSQNLPSHFRGVGGILKNKHPCFYLVRSPCDEDPKCLAKERGEERVQCRLRVQEGNHSIHQLGVPN